MNENITNIANGIDSITTVIETIKQKIIDEKNDTEKELNKKTKLTWFGSSNQIEKTFIHGTKNINIAITDTSDNHLGLTLLVEIYDINSNLIYRNGIINSSINLTENVGSIKINRREGMSAEISIIALEYIE